MQTQFNDERLDIFMDLLFDLEITCSNKKNYNYKKIIKVNVIKMNVTMKKTHEFFYIIQQINQLNELVKLILS